MQAGLINRIAAPDELDAVIAELTGAIVASSPLTVRLGKEAFYRQMHLDESSAYDDAVEVMTRNAVAHDAQEGIAAFLQKRPAVWKGE